MIAKYYENKFNSFYFFLEVRPTEEVSNRCPYSSSLENLDPSAKEFLVDAGVLLEKSSITPRPGKITDVLLTFYTFQQKKIF